MARARTATPPAWQVLVVLPFSQAEAGERRPLDPRGRARVHGGGGAPDDRRDATAQIMRAN